MVLSDLTKVMADESASVYKKAFYVLLFELGIELYKDKESNKILISNVTSSPLNEDEVCIIEKAINNED